MVNITILSSTVNGSTYSDEYDPISSDASHTLIIEDELETFESLFQKLQEFANEETLRKKHLENEMQIRHIKHSECLQCKSNPDHITLPPTHFDKNESNPLPSKWPKNTMLIASDSISSGINEKKTHYGRKQTSKSGVFQLQYSGHPHLFNTTSI